MPAKKTYRKRSSSSTSVSDCMCLDDDSDIADLKDLIEEDTDPLDENFDIVRDLGVNKYTTDLENNNTIDQKKKTTDIISRSEERKEDKNTVITKIKNEVKRVRNVVGESEGRNMAVEIVIGNRTKRRNKTTEVICGLERRKTEDEVVMGSIIQKTNEATDVTFGLERSKLEEKAIIVTGERNEKKKIGRETVCGPKGGKVKDEIVTVNIIQKKNEATDVPCGIKRGKMEETTITGTKTEENKKKKKIGDGEFVSGSEKKEMEAEGVDDNLDEKTEENIEEVNYALHDNVMVRYFSRNKWTYYIGYITAIFSNEMYEIRFYKTCKKPLKFKHTKKVDRDTVPAIYIVKKVHLLQDLSCPNEFLLSDKKDFIFFS
ncbi:hypothetical protein O0L34_g11207 [Tuta absoluta]|nr:hypothetical protein O0L34_g11207 [Tuta absoluta]